MKVHTFYYKDIFPISFKNGMVNGTEIANVFRKRPIEDKEEITWMSLELALDFSEWLDLEFSRWLELIIKKNYKNSLK
jgi:hypothetical protein